MIETRRIGRGTVRFQDLLGPCLYAKKGQGPRAKTCICGFECRHCAHEQWLEEMARQILSAEAA